MSSAPAVLRLSLVNKFVRRICYDRFVFRDIIQNGNGFPNRQDLWVEPTVPENRKGLTKT